MHLTRIQLPSADLPATAGYYRDVLGLPVRESDDYVRVGIGSTQVEFIRGPVKAGSNHLAITIPRNRFADAKRWLSARTEVLSLDGQDEFPLGEPWSSESIYFRGPDGIVLELIARHRLNNASSEAFNAGSLLSVSEVGLAVPNVRQSMQDIEDTFGIQPFAGDAETFHAVGDHHGLLILVSAGRRWFPTTDAASAFGPADVRMAGTSRSGTMESAAGWKLTSPGDAGS
jgi:catechol-2,3-dioxygenase